MKDKDTDTQLGLRSGTLHGVWLQCEMFFPPLPFVVLVPLSTIPSTSGNTRNSTRRLCSPIPQLHFHQNEKLICLWNRLTGLLSFMLSDEITTGSITSSESHKRAFAARSHNWNVAQPRFKDAFPEVSNLSRILSLSLFLGRFLLSIL